MYTTSLNSVYINRSGIIINTNSNKDKTKEKYISIYTLAKTIYKNNTNPTK